MDELQVSKESCIVIHRRADAVEAIMLQIAKSHT
jgi:hypothetical protein